MNIDTVFYRVISQVRTQLRIAASQLRYDVRTVVGHYPGVFLPLLRLKRWSRGRDTSGIVDANTEIVIEGFPRSGNTFTVAAFAFAQRRMVRTAHHLHVPAHVIEAARLGVPTLVIVRHPKDAIVALKMMYPDLSVSRILKSYVNYHRAILPLVDACVIATFEQVTSDLGTVIQRCNEKYNTSFDRFVHTEENVEKVFAVLRAAAYARIPDRASIGVIPDPQSPREQQKALLKEKLDFLWSGRNYQLASHLYNNLVLRAGQ